MKAEIRWPWEIKSPIPGPAVVIDVFAATTNLATLLARGAKEVHLTTDDHILEVIGQFPQALVVGESFVLPPDRFHSTNFPGDVASLDVTDREVLFLSANGAKAIDMMLALTASQVITASFANITAVADWLGSRSDHEVTLVPAGKIINCREEVEDLVAATCLAALLDGQRVNWQRQLTIARQAIYDYYPPDSADAIRNVDVAMDKDRYAAVPLSTSLSPGIISVKDASY